MTNKDFIKCEYRRRNDNPFSAGYCANPVRHEKINGIALLHCQGCKCDLETKEKWW